MNQFFGFSKAQKRTITILAVLALLVGTYKFINDYYARPTIKPLAWEVVYPENYRPVLMVDINRAPVDSLELVPGLGPVLSQRIVNYRNRYGGFAAVDSLILVDGIGPAKLKTIKPYLKASVR